MNKGSIVSYSYSSVKEESCMNLLNFGDNYEVTGVSGDRIFLKGYETSFPIKYFKVRNCDSVLQADREDLY